MIFNEVMYHNDEYFILADFHNYDQARFETEKLYSNKLRWAKMCLINIANSGISLQIELLRSIIAIYGI